MAVVLYLAVRMGSGTAPKEVSYSEFLGELQAGHLSEVQISETQVIGLLKRPPAEKKPQQEQRIRANRLPGVDDSALLKEMEEQHVKFAGEIEQSSWIWSVLGWLLPLGFILLIYGAGMRRLAQGAEP